MTVEEASGPAPEVWPCCWAAVDLFVRIGTQWRVSQSGPFGLDYNVLYHKMDRMNLRPEDYEQLEDDIRVMEAEALDEMRKERG